MEADISPWASDPRREPRKRVLARRLAHCARSVRIGCALGALSLCACSADAKRAVDVREPTPTPSDAGALDADAAPDAAPPLNPRGVAPVWPPSEQTLNLDLTRGGRALLTLVPDPSRLDVHFNVDTTASFSGEINAIQRELTRSIIPRLRSRVANTQLGVSRFADFPVVPFGRPASRGIADVPYKLLSAISDGLAKVTTAVNALDRPLGEGGDGPEAAAEALFQIATGEGLDLNGRSIIEPFDRAAAAAQGGGTIGGVGFRTGAFRVVVHITDALSHQPQEYAARDILNTHSLQSAALALKAIGVHVISICSTGPSASGLVRAELSVLALLTGADTAAVNDRCPTGLAGAFVSSYDGRCPWVFDINQDGSGLADSITGAVLGLLDEARFAAVHAEVGDDPLGFIQKIELTPVSQRAGVSTPQTADLLPAGAPDGIPDSYLDVNREHKLGFAVSLSDARIAPSESEQHFRVSVRLVADSVLLEERVLGVRISAVAQPWAADEDAGPKP